MLIARSSYEQNLEPVSAWLLPYAKKIERVMAKGKLLGSAPCISWEMGVPQVWVSTLNSVSFEAFQKVLDTLWLLFIDNRYGCCVLPA